MQYCQDRSERGPEDGRRRAGAGRRRCRPRTSTCSESVKPIEQHGFTIIDFTPDKMVLRQFKWDVKTRPVEAMDTLQPFHTAELVRPG